MKVRELMTAPPVSVSSDAPVRRIIELLDEHRISAVPVVDPQGVVVGVVSEGDLVAKGHRGERTASANAADGSYRRAYDRRAAGRNAGEVMTTHAITVDQSDDVRVAARLMTKHTIGRVPVTLEGRLVGILSRADVLKAFLRPDEEIEREIREEIRSKVPGDTTDVGIVVRDGIVTLTGSVELASTADVVAFHVDRVPGVLCVDSRLAFRVDDESSAESVMPAPLGPLEMIL